jgi:hypothetical protein
MARLRPQPPSTIFILIAGLIFAILGNLSFYAWVYDPYWPWAQSFPISWIGAGMVYMAVFFHEIGHTLTMWFFGYPALPMFDLQHGGGMSAMMGEQNMLVLAGVWAAILYGIWQFRWHKGIVAGLVLLLAINLACAFNDWHEILINFMGHGFEALIAGFLLFRALFNLAPRGGFERFLNAYFGFGLIFKAFIDFSGLLHNQTHRLSYYTQKGAHGFGDFDKITNYFYKGEFADVVLFALAFNAACLIVPFAIFILARIFGGGEPEEEPRYHFRDKSF